MASVSFSNIKKSYGDVDIIRGVSFTVEAGEFLVMVGPSGCGKSTLLRIVAGLEEITAGDLKIGERVVNDVPPRERGVAMVFQSYALYPHMTVRENLEFGLKIRKESQDLIRQRVETAAKMLDITQYLDRLPKQLSGGQRQRVAIGRAIVRQPDVMLFDEPLSNLDASLRTQMRVELKKLHHELGATMIYVTHDQVEAMTLADRIVVLNQGIIQQIGSPAELFERPANRFVAAFIGSPSMNFLRGELGDGRFKAEGLNIRVDKTPFEVGIRPQHLEITQDEDSEVVMQVEVVEPMGWEAHVHGMCGAQRMVAHVRHDAIANIRPGDTLRFNVEEGCAHCFDESGLAL
ncbi:MAG: sn-glycerol-3-phosphate ABC transporter ATP-binding protein UgpC [bacterium]